MLNETFGDLQKLESRREKEKLPRKGRLSKQSWPELLEARGLRKDCWGKFKQSLWESYDLAKKIKISG